MATLVARLKAFLNSRPLSISIAMVAIALAALAYAVHQMGYFGRSESAGPPPKAYFYNEATGELVVGSSMDVPPLPDASGKPTLVRAYCYTTGTDDQKKILYLERYTREAKGALEAIHAGQDPTTDAGIALGKGPLVRSPETGSRWVYARSDEGQALIEGRELNEPDRAKMRPVLPP